MKSKLLFILLIAVALVACGSPAADPILTEQLPAVASESTSGCPEATDGTQALTDDTLGYCVLIPTGYNFNHPIPEEAIIAAGDTLDESQTRLFINIEAAEGRTPEDYADLISAGAEQFGVTRTAAVLGGEPAIVLEKLPGQDVSRQIVTIHNDRIYRLTFVPMDPGNPEKMAETEALYALVASSWAFLP